MGSEVEVHEITEEEYAAAKARLIALLKAEFEWWDKLADCHIKCSDLDYKLRYSLWMLLTDKDIAEIYAEAERIRNA